MKVAFEGRRFRFLFTTERPRGHRMTDQLQSDVLVCVPISDETRARAAAYVRRQPDADTLLAALGLDDK